MEHKIALALADSSPIYRKALRTILGKSDLFEVQAEAEDRLDLMAQNLKIIEVVLIDIEWLLQDHFHVVRQVRLKNPNIRFVALSLNTDELFFSKVLSLGVDAIVPKHASRGEMIEAIQSVLNRQIYISESYQSHINISQLISNVMKTKKVLLVDDDIDVITIVKAILLKEGFEVYTASNKTEAVKLAHEVNPDLAILDVMMTTHYEGFELAKSFKEDVQLKRIPVLIQSSIEILISSDHSVIDMAKFMRNQAQYKELDVLLIKDINSGRAVIDYRTSDNQSHWLEVEGFLKKPAEADYLINTIRKWIK